MRGVRTFACVASLVVPGCSLDGLAGGSPDAGADSGGGASDAAPAADAGAVPDVVVHGAADGGGLLDGGFDCSVHTDGKLYCRNTPGADLHAEPTLTSPVVNHLRTTYSYFECWGTGDLHAGGNTTWYRTIGDDNANRGWAAGVDLKTPDAFDANPSAFGLARCT